MAPIYVLIRYISDVTTVQANAFRKQINEYIESFVEKVIFSHYYCEDDDNINEKVRAIEDMSDEDILKLVNFEADINSEIVENDVNYLRGHFGLSIAELKNGR